MFKNKKPSIFIDGFLVAGTGLTPSLCSVVGPWGCCFTKKHHPLRECVFLFPSEADTSIASS